MTGGIFHIFNHALYKGLLFLTAAGSIVLLLSSSDQGQRSDVTIIEEFATAIPLEFLDEDESILNPQVIPTIAFPDLAATAEPEREDPEATVPVIDLP